MVLNLSIIILSMMFVKWNKAVRNSSLESSLRNSEEHVYIYVT